VRGASFRGYGASLALGIAIPIPVLNASILKRTCIRDRDISAPVVDYSHDYQNCTGKTLGHVTYEELKSGTITIRGKKIPVGSLSSYNLALEAAHMLADEIRRKDFLLSRPSAMLPATGKLNSLKIRKKG